MLRISVPVVLCGVALITPTLAQDQSVRFQYSPIARLTNGGQYRAEVWRRDVATGREDLAWSNHDLHAGAAKAMDDACTSLRTYYDASFSCLRMASEGLALDQRAAGNVAETPASEPPVAVVEKKTPQSDAAAKAVPGRTATPERQAVTAAKTHPKVQTGPSPRVMPAAKIATPPEGERKLVWAKNFWSYQSRWSGGGGEGGGDGGGSGGGTE